MATRTEERVKDRIGSLTGVEVADDGVLAEARLPPRAAARDEAAGAGEPEELPRPRRVQLAPAVGEHRHHAGLLWSSSSRTKSTNRIGQFGWRVINSRRGTRSARRSLTRDLGGLGGVEVGGEPIDVLGVRVEDRVPRLVLAALRIPPSTNVGRINLS